MNFETLISKKLWELQGEELYECWNEIYGNQCLFYRRKHGDNDNGGCYFVHWSYTGIQFCRVMNHKHLNHIKNLDGKRLVSVLLISLADRNVSTKCLGVVFRYAQQKGGEQDARNQEAQKR